MGDCFEVAFALVQGDPTAVLCHGTAMGQGPIEGIRHWHAWVEHEVYHDVPSGTETVRVRTILVTDRSNGKDVTVPDALYYRIGQIQDVQRYKQPAAILMAVSKGTYGPWHKAEVDA